jgi:hypothetical protein
MIIIKREKNEKRNEVLYKVVKVNDAEIKILES